MFKRKISIFYLLIAAASGSLAGIGAYQFINKKVVESRPALPPTPENCEYTISRLEGFKYTQPVYMAEPKFESNNFLGLKTSITDMLEGYKASGDLQYASVFVKDLNTNDWMNLNPENRYHPGSLFKIITMTTLLKMAESNMSILDKEVVFNQNLNVPTQTFNSRTIQPGRKYKVKELMYYMIVYSDNNATMLLHNYMDVNLFQKIFTDLGLPKPNVADNSYTLPVKDYSRFVSILYDGSYLSIPSCEFAISLLCESNFAQGVTKELPKNLRVAHKFGEAGHPGDRELHESAIVYLHGHPYLITVMTRGKEAAKLAEIISHISKMTYDHMAGFAA